MRSPMDHLIVVSPDLGDGITYVQDVLGVGVQPGGQHQGRGTRNVLVGLGPDTFLEILSVDPEQPPPPGRRWLGVDDVNEPTLLSWAAKSSDLAATVTAGRAAGIDLGEPSGASREKPDGTVISWGFTDPTAERMRGLVPFFLDWGQTPHPGASMPQACTFVDLTAECPEPEALQRVVDGLGLDIAVRPGNQRQLIARLDTPKGVVELR